MACNNTKQKLSTMIFGLTLLLMSVANISFAKDVTLTWDANQEADIAGYKIHYGTSPGTYTGAEANTGVSPIFFGKTTSATLIGLDDTTPHYFTVTAYNLSGEESAYAEEVIAPVQSNNDLDGDRSPYPDDCDDNDATIHPGAAEVCDGVDNNCSGEADDGLTFASYSLDADGDTFGNAVVSISTCDGAPAGYVADNTDCDDSTAATYPGAVEIACDGIDQSCNGADAVCPADPIELLNPTGGEQWSSSFEQSISWKVGDTPSLVDTVVIEYSKNDRSWKTLKMLRGKQALTTNTTVEFPTTRKSKEIKVKVTVKNAQGVVMGKKNSEYLTLTR